MKKIRPLPNAPKGDGWFQITENSTFAVDDYVRIVKGGPYFERYAEVLEIWGKSDEVVRYTVRTIDLGPQETIRGLGSENLRPANLNAMEILGLQADPKFRERGREES